MKESITSYFNGNYYSFYSHYLPNLKHERGNEYKAKCCFHDDKNPSLNVNSETGQFHCFGCEASGDIFTFYQQLHGLNGNFQEVLNSIANDFGIVVESQSNRGKIVDTYDYQDAEGNLIFQTVRLEPKDFRQRRPDSSGGYIWNLKGITPFLYNLPEVLKANKVLIVEGEKDCDNLAKIGFIATTCPMGAGKWREHYNPYLEGKDVVIIPDNDEQGQKHARQIAEQLHDVARSVKLIELPNLSPKGDSSDFLASINDPEMAVEQLSILIENAEPYKPSEIPADSGNGFHCITLESIFSEKIEEKPIAKGILNEDDQTVIYAPGGVGKSLITQDITMALGSNFKDLWGLFEILKPRISLIIQSENGRLPVYQRTRLKCEGNPNYLLGLQNVIFAARHNSIQSAGHVSDQQFRAELIEFAKRAEVELETKIDVIVWDPLISYHDADENDNSRMRTTLDHISEVSNQIGATPIVIHHANKEGGIRGASAIFDWARNIIRLEDATHRGKKHIKLTHEKCNNAKMFEPFVLAMDEYLNFSKVDPDAVIPAKKQERCLKVREALTLVGSSAKTKTQLIKQYKEITGLKTESTIHNHIDDAVENDFIQREHYWDGSVKKARYFLE